MSTRCNVIIQDNYNKLWFYRHSDGYPSCTGESLKTFLRWLIDQRIRDNAEQAAGWLIIMGAKEYDTRWNVKTGKDEPKATVLEPLQDSMGWKCGAYEPSVGEHGDIEYLYVIDLPTKELRCCRPGKAHEPFFVVNAQNIDKPIGGEPTDE